MTLKLLGRIVWETFQWVALFGGLLGLATGLALIFNSALVQRISQRMNVWVSTRQAMRPLDTPIEVERTIYRSHQVIGVLILGGALFTLYVLLIRFDAAQVVNALAKLFRLGVAPWVAQSLRIFLLVVNAAAALVAVVMIVRPSALKGVEAWANRSYSGRHATRAWEIPRAGPDALVWAHPRLIGAVLSVAGIYVVLTMGFARFVTH